MERRRRDFLLAQLKAASTRLRMMQGEKLAFADEAEGLFGVRPELKPLAAYDPILARIERLVPGRGPLADRVDAFQERFIDPPRPARAGDARRHRRMPPPDARAYRFAGERALHARIRHRQELGRLQLVQGRFQQPHPGQYRPSDPHRPRRRSRLPRRLSGPSRLQRRCSSRSWRRARGWVEFTPLPALLAAKLHRRRVGQLRHRARLSGRRPARLRDPRSSTRSPACRPRGAAQYLALQEAMQDLAGARFTIAADYLDGRIDRAAGGRARPANTSWSRRPGRRSRSPSSTNIAPT